MHISILNQIGQILHFGRHFGFWLLRHISQTKGTMGLILKPYIDLNTFYIFFLAHEIVGPLVLKWRSKMASFPLTHV